MNRSKVDKSKNSIFNTQILVFLPERCVKFLLIVCSLNNKIVNHC